MVQIPTPMDPAPSASQPAYEMPDELRDRFVQRRPKAPPSQATRNPAAGVRKP
ncbi:hypothetical protein ABZ604_23010 [Streptomyces sp. NPDC012473]|uniref:hypothetical protein n=1 Tax=Streptomyces sp. NPDC012473 TaxID=3156676 RepID=UPI0033EFCBC7